jgi:hypothetical protein
LLPFAALWSTGVCASRSPQAAFAHGALDALESLDLRSNRVGEAGFEALAAALRSGAAPALRYVYAGGNLASDVGVRKALRKRTATPAGGRSAPSGAASAERTSGAASGERTSGAASTERTSGAASGERVVGSATPPHAPKSAARTNSPPPSKLPSSAARSSSPPTSAGARASPEHGAARRKSPGHSKQPQQPAKQPQQPSKLPGAPGAAKQQQQPEAAKQQQQPGAAKQQQQHLQKQPTFLSLSRGSTEEDVDSPGTKMRQQFAL